MTYGLKIVSSRLLITNVGVDAGITSCSCKVLSLSKGNMLSIRIFVAFGQTKVNNVDVIFSGFSTTNQEVIWLNISVNNSFLMDLLDPLYLFD